MKAFFKTLFGDLYNLAFVALVVGSAALMIRYGFGQDSVYAVPATLLLGIGFFARR